MKIMMMTMMLTSDDYEDDVNKAKYWAFIKNDYLTSLSLQRSTCAHVKNQFGFDFKR